MIFTIVFEEEGLKYHSLKTREAVRAVILGENGILLVRSNRSDYKFPGGGVKGNEDWHDALLREVAEETGYIHAAVKNKLGTVIERKIDEFDDTVLFQMNSHYYLCELIDHQQLDQQLEGYEITQEFSPEWVAIEEAIARNEAAAKLNGANRWIRRENFVLNALLEQ
ncbi:NUDIX hydrolase [Cytobacillus firmus]|uniref:NUDIX hydrolase n=1 Tax=Cytobacillus firmus DS1 TaxID=1307436 RepID=W7KU03_CYTFI|nr:NUDIX domain-containing protein [Cytobacillus firmus]EWG10995.1 NUDIX hydrolase [Cytobacillus firmus DS1]